MHFATKQFHNLKQNADESDSDFHERLDNAVTAVESHKGKLGCEVILLEQDETFQALSALEQASSTYRKAAEKRNREQFLTFCIIAKADYKQHGE